jgi:predicted MFS family arabinose efflux permease
VRTVGPGATRPPLDHGRLAVLGLVTICAYGAWYYAFGVLLDPSVEDTGWSYTTLSASFSAGQVVIGIGAIGGGALLDRRSGRTVFATAAVVGGGALGVVSVAGDPVVFAVAAAVGMGAFGALGFYHVTMAVAVRTNPASPGRAIAVLTLWGALSSAIYLPLTAWLVESLGWRSTVRILALSAVVALAVAAVLVPCPGERSTDRPSWRARAASLLDETGPRSLTIAVGLAGVAVSVLLVYQVPVMVAAGLSATVAATVAGIRGIAQLGGRLPLGRLLARTAARRLLVVALAAIAAGAAVLGVAGSVPVALLFALLAGFGIGAWSPLQGVYAEELFERPSLGTTMGLYSAIHMSFGAVGPVVAGVVTDATGDPRPAVLLAVGAALLAAVVMARSPVPAEARRR